MESVQEGKANIKTQVANIPSRDMEVFYNPVMKFNRDFSVALLRNVSDKGIRVLDPMAATGIRAIRFEKEIGKIKYIHANDISRQAIKLMKSNIKLNKCKKIKVTNIDANLISGEYDYIDIDPFGYPGPYIQNAISNLKLGKILAVTATDTAALTGSAPKACKRKYLADNTRNWMMHEIGLRILIGWVARKALENGKSIEVLASYSKEHYMRVFTRLKAKKKMPIGFIWRCDKCLDFGSGTNAQCNCGAETRISGPLWVGKLGDAYLLKKIRKEMSGKFLDYLQSDYESTLIGFHDIHEICSKHKTKAVPKFEAIMKHSKAKRTSFSQTGIKTKRKTKEVLKSIQKSF